MSETGGNHAPGRLRTAGWFVAGVLAVLLPASLLWNPDGRFYYDWHNHQWFVGYVGEYFRQHWTMPQVYNAAPVVGLPQPIFYGTLLFPLLGMISALTGAAIALRVAIIGVFAVQFVAVNIAARLATGSRFQAFVIAACVTWAIHPMTNLYNRAALTEFFGIGFLTTSIALGAAAFLASGARTRLLIWLSGAAAVLAAGAHPPTAIVGGAFVAVLVILGAILAIRSGTVRRDLWVPGAAIALLGLLMLGPWILANIELRHDIYITAKLREFVFMPERTDAFWGRLAPFPYDAMAGHKPSEVSTPHADAQISVPLLLLCAVNAIVLFRRRNAGVESRPAVGRATAAFAVLGAAWAVLTVSLSLMPGIAHAFSALASYVQFPSRFASHANLALLVTVLATSLLAWGSAPGARMPGAVAAVYAAAVALALCGACVKLSHGAFVMEKAHEPRYAWRGDRSGLVTDGRMDAATDYASVLWIPQFTRAKAKMLQHVSFPVGASGGNFGRVGATQVEVAKPDWVVTNAVAFRWSAILVDGRRVEVGRAEDHRAAIFLEAGTHTLSYVWAPDPRWLLARSIAAWAALAVVVGGIVLAVSAAMSERRPDPRTQGCLTAVTVNR